MDKVVNSLFNKSNSIVLVGNSKALVGKGHGKFIDSHDTVVRFNNGIPYGYETDVGNKITVWATFFKGKTQDEHLANFLFKLRRECSIWINWSCLKKIPTLFKKDDKVLLLPDETYSSAFALYHYDMDIEGDTEEIKQKYLKVKNSAKKCGTPSTGLITLYYISKYLDYRFIDIIGFDCFAIKKNFFKSASNICAQHFPEKEKKMMDKIVNNNDRLNWITFNGGERT